MTTYVHFETDKGEMVAEMFDDEAPNTVEHFVGLAEGTKEWTDPKTKETVARPFYDGLTFHRVVPNFVIQGGCPLGTGTGGPGYHIKCECDDQGVKHERGTLSMAHAGRDTGGSQFFVCHAPQPHLDGKHTVFGKVVQGDEVIDQIEAGDRMTRVWVERK